MYFGEILNQSQIEKTDINIICMCRWYVDSLSTKTGSKKKLLLWWLYLCIFWCTIAYDAQYQEHKWYATFKVKNWKWKKQQKTNLSWLTITKDRSVSGNGFVSLSYMHSLLQCAECFTLSTPNQSDARKHAVTLQLIPF